MKRKKIAIMGALIAVVSMVMLIMPLNLLFAIGGPPQMSATLDVSQGTCDPVTDTTPVTFDMTQSGYSWSSYRWDLTVNGEAWGGVFSGGPNGGPTNWSENTDLGPGDYNANLKITKISGSGQGVKEDINVPFTVSSCAEPEIPPVTTTTTTTTTTAAAYTITASVDDHGTITDEGATSVSQGSSKAYSMDTVSTACGIVEVLVDGVSIGKVNSYTFDDVNADHTIHVITRCTPPAPVEEEIEVLGIAELPFTGQSMIFYILGFAMIAIAGGLVFALRAVKSKE
jgi:hypothetical protein